MSIKKSITKQIRFLRIPKYSRILDIGSGSDPFWRATILVEKYLSDNSQRPGNMVINRPLICADIEELPFRDKAFDFIHCSHILEHLDNPDKAIEEIKRCGKEGYIEVPNEIRERLILELPYHKWYVNLDNENRLVFKSKSIKNSKPILAAYQKRPDIFNTFTRFIEKNTDIFNIRIFWKDDIKYQFVKEKEIFKTTNQSIEGEKITLLSNQNVDKDNVSRITGLKGLDITRKIWVLIKYTLFLLFKPKQGGIEEIIVCPICKGDFNLTDNFYICKRCKVKYPIINNIPFLIRSEAVKVDL